MSNKFEVRIVKEEYPLPTTNADVAQLVREVLDAVEVNKIIIEAETGVLVHRIVPASMCDEPEVALDSIIRTVEFEEYYNDEGGAFEVLVDMFRLVQRRKLFGVYFASGTGGKDIINKWMKTEERGMPPYEGEGILGIPVMQLRSLPDETLILCGAPKRDSEVEEVCFVVKTAMEIRDEGDEEIDEDDVESGDNSKSPGRTDGAVEAVATRGLGDLWIPTGVFGGRPGSGF